MFGLNILLRPAKAKTSSNFSYIDAEATITEIVQQEKRWRIEHRGTYWNAFCTKSTALMLGDTVYVVGKHDSTTLVISQNWVEG